MSPRRPADSRLELIDARHYEPQLRHSGFLGVPPSEAAQADRAAALRTWQALQATPEDVVRDRAELEKIDRAVVAMRKEVLAVRGESKGLREHLARVEQERFPAAAVWSLGALAALAGGAWLYERRKARARSAPALAAGQPSLPASPPTVAATQPRGDSTFDSTDPNTAAEEAEEWIERLRVGAPR